MLVMGGAPGNVLRKAEDYRNERAGRLHDYRAPRVDFRPCPGPAIADVLVRVFREPGPLLRPAEAADDQVAVLPVVHHLMRRQVVGAHLSAAPLRPQTVVRRLAADGYRVGPASRRCR